MGTTTIDKRATRIWIRGGRRLAEPLRRPVQRIFYRSAPGRHRGLDGDPRASEPTPGTTPAPHLLLTVHEACAVLRVSRWTLYRLIQARQLDTIKIGSRRCVPVASIHALIDRLSDREAA